MRTVPNQQVMCRLPNADMLNISSFSWEDQYRMSLENWSSSCSYHSEVGPSEFLVIIEWVRNVFTLDQSLRYYTWFHWSAEPAGRVLRLFTGSCWGSVHHPSVLGCLKCGEVVTSCHLCRCICLNKPNRQPQKLHRIGSYSYAVYVPAGILKVYTASDVHINTCLNTRWRLYIIRFHMYKVMAAFWWAGCPRGGFKVL